MDIVVSIEAGAKAMTTRREVTRRSALSRAFARRARFVAALARALEVDA